MSTILDALRRLQADRDEDVPTRDLKKALTERPGPRRPPSMLRRARVGAVSIVGGVGIGAALGVWTFSGGILSGAESGSGAETELADRQNPPPEDPQPAYGVPDLAQAQADMPTVQEGGDPSMAPPPPLEQRSLEDLAGADSTASVDVSDSPRVSSRATTDLPAVQGPRAGELDGQRTAPRPRAEGPPPSVPGGFSAIAQRRPGEPSPQGPPPAQAAAETRPATAPARESRPQPTPPAVRDAAPRRDPAPAPAPLPPPAEPVYDPIPFPDLAVANVRWHPDPKRREASVEVDGAVAIKAREGDLVGGALLARIAPGEVEFKVGVRSKVVRVGK